MKKASYVVIILCAVLLNSACNELKKLQFWDWFQNNEKMLYDFEHNQEHIFDLLSHQLSKVNPELTFEFGPIDENGRREFVISAGGIKSAFPSVEALYKSAPDLKRWKLVKFRQRRSPLNDISFGGKLIKVEDVRYAMFEDGEKVGIILFFEGYNKIEKNLFDNIGYLFLDEALGEYDMETKVGFVEFHDYNSGQYRKSKPLKVLSKSFDLYFRKRETRH